ncbi:hypothetical protein [Endozoicomonas sp. SCSIO W0465]|uniref:hypothetical protein n=1 Tax=Endozoicomonas sp. SCSIO W0465 TaxID=2918516 RepID=UPI002075C08B|nr:hypothetical protein [Endozoicomonas sp. SCSIO W0465]USE34231.1 hypothetical protein MJO57_18955 [Endozoicomonas sp. SCSIO W0465]
MEYESSKVSVTAPGIALRKGTILAETRGCHFGYPLMSLTIENQGELPVLETVLAPLSPETLSQLRLCDMVEKLFAILAAIPLGTGMALEALLNQYNQWLNNLEWLDEHTCPVLQLAAVNGPISLRHDQGINCAQLNKTETSTSTGKGPLTLVKIPNRPAGWNYYKQTSFFVEFKNIRQLADIPWQTELYSLLDAVWWHEARDIATSLLKEFGIKTEHENTIPVFMHWSYNCLKIINYGFKTESFGGQRVVRHVPLSIRVGSFQAVLELLSDETVKELVTSINKDQDNYLYEFLLQIFVNYENRKELRSQRVAYDKLEQWLFHEVQELFKVLKIRYQHGKHHVYNPFSPTPYIVTKDNEKLILPDPGKTADFLQNFVLAQRNDNYYFLYELTAINEANYCVVEFRLHQGNNKGSSAVDLPFNNPDRPFDPTHLSENEQQMMTLLFEGRTVQTLDNNLWLQSLLSLLESFPDLDTGQTKIPV